MKAKKGLWSGTFDRARKGTIRIEDDLIGSNIRFLETVDMGSNYLFADEDLIIDERDEFTYEELLTHRNSIEAHGWLIPTVRMIESIVDDPFVCIHEHGDKFLLESTQPHVRATLFEDRRYWCRDTDNFFFFRKNIYKIFTIFSTSEWMEEKMKVRLVKKNENFNPEVALYESDKMTITMKR